MPEDTLQGTGDKSTVYHHYSVLIIIITRFHILLTVHARKVTCSHYTHSVSLCMQRQGGRGGIVEMCLDPARHECTFICILGNTLFYHLIFISNINIPRMSSIVLISVTSRLCDLRKQWVTSYSALISVTV